MIKNRRLDHFQITIIPILSSKQETDLNFILFFGYYFESWINEYLNMESVRQKQTAEMVKRHFSLLLQQEGSYIYGDEVLVTVTSVKMTPDFSLAKIYLSVYNTDHKQEVMLELDENVVRLRQGLASRIRKHVRRIPDIALYLDDTLDEIYRLNELFDRLHKENQMGNDTKSE